MNRLEEMEPMDVPGIGNIYQGPGAGGSRVGLRALWKGDVAAVWRRETRGGEAVFIVGWAE